MIVVLIGYMGSGKSTIGKKLSKKTGFNLIDLDDYIEEKEKMTVSQIFESKGEIYFRKQETKYLKLILETMDNIILSLGGGTPCYGSNMELILKEPKAKSFYLNASVKTLSKKLFKKKLKRPLIAHINSKEAMTEFVGKHLFERSQYYNQAEHVILTDKKSKRKIVKKIKKLL